MSALDPAVWIDAVRSHKRLTIAVAVGLSLPLVAWLWREGDLPDVSRTPFSRAASTYNVDGVYGPGGWLLPVALRHIEIHHDTAVINGEDGKLVVGVADVRSVSGSIAQVCGIHAGSAGAVLLSRHGHRLRIEAGRCVIDGRRA